MFFFRGTPYLLLVAMLLLSWGLLAAPLFADEITLKNGDRLSGTVVNAKVGRLHFTTPYAAKVPVRMDQIETIVTDEPVTLRFHGTQVLKGRLETRDGQIYVLAGDARGDTLIAWDQVRSINVPDITWSGNIFLGGAHQSGNTDRMSISLGAEAVRRSLNDRFSLSFLYNYAEEDGELTTRDAYGAMKYDYFFTAKFYGLLSAELLKDKFKDLNLRAVVGPGLGYQVWEEARKSLAFEAGVAYFSEDRIEGEDEQWATARLAAVFHYQFFPWLRFADTFILYPHLEDLGEYTLRNDASLITGLGSAWSLRLGNLWERDSDPAPDVKKDDFRTTVSLQYSF
jgi:putative salt-induced outer membrane protein YdiY